MSQPIIRLAEAQDTTQILEIYAPFIQYTTTSFELVVPNPDEFWKRIEGIMQQSPWLVCEINGKIVGYAYASEHRGRAAYQWNREVSVYVHTEFRGYNIATALYQTLFKLVRLQGYANVLAGIVQPNEASVRFHEKQGFKLVGIYHNIGYKMGQWQHVSWWELPLINQSTTPSALKTMKELITSDCFQEFLLEGVSLIKPI